MVASLAIIYPIAVAYVEAVLSAVSPDPELDEPRKRPGKSGIEFPGVNPPGDLVEDLGAPTEAVAGGAVRMVCGEPGQDSGPDQEIVDQRVDRDHPGADFDPIAPFVGGA